MFVICFGQDVLEDEHDWDEAARPGTHIISRFWIF
jgi:hypothetical protein